MSDKSKKYFNNSLKVISIAAGAAVLFAIWFSIQFGKSKTKAEFDKRQTYFNDIHEFFNKDWAKNEYWNNHIENPVFMNDSGTILKYVIQKEIFNDQFNVKTSTTERPDLYDVIHLKLNRSNKNTNESAQASLMFLRMNPLVLHKMTESSHHSDGITFKSYFNQKSIITMNYNSFMDKEGEGVKVFQKDVFFEDQLPFTLRALNFDDSVKFKANVLESQLKTSALNSKVYNALFTVNKTENDSLWCVNVAFDSVKTNRYFFDIGFPHELKKFQIAGSEFIPVTVLESR